jgi:hypothetical protein
MATMALAAVGNYQLAGLVPVSAILKASSRVGDLFGSAPKGAQAPAFRILQ